MILPGFCVSTMFTSRSNKAWSVQLEVILITLNRGSTASHRLGFRVTTKNGMTQIRVGPRDDKNDAEYYSMSQGKMSFKMIASFYPNSCLHTTMFRSCVCVCVCVCVCSCTEDEGKDWSSTQKIFLGIRFLWHSRSQHSKCFQHD